MEDKYLEENREIVNKNSSNILIRKVNPKDATQYIQHINTVWRSAYKHIFPEKVFIDRENNAYKKIETFSNNYYNDNTKMCYIAEDNGIIVGAIYGTIKSTYEYYEGKGFADLVALYIKPEYQGIGIGKKLKDIFIKWAKENGAKKFVIGVLKDNIKARKVYEKWGGKLDEYVQPLYKLGVKYDEVFYTYDL